jgi:hypothetical protein
MWFYRIHDPEGGNSRQALSSLSQTCSRILEIARAELFRGFSELIDRKLLLLLTVLRKPALTRHVERLNLQDAGEKFVGAGEFLYSYDYDELKLEDTPKEAAIHGLGIDFADERIERLRDESARVLWDALLALYLAFFPALREVRFSWPAKDAVLVGKLIAEAPRLIPSWETLLSLSIQPFHENEDPEFNGATGILTWPRLRCLRTKTSL